MTRIIRRLPTGVKLIALAAVAVTFSNASGDSAVGSFAVIAVAGWLVWSAIAHRPRAKRRPASRRGQARRPPSSNRFKISSKPATSPRQPFSRSAAAGSGLVEVQGLSAGAFEEFTLELLKGLGYTDLRRIGGAGDLGVDITGRDTLGRKAVVQCKRYAPHRKITSPMVQSFIGMMTVHHQADHGLIVSTGGFTTDTADLARHHGIVLIDGAALAELLRGNDHSLRRQTERSWWRF